MYALLFYLLWNELLIFTMFLQIILGSNTMANYGHGTGNYLTSFEDYYKSSEESEEDIKAPVDSDNDSSCYYTESEEEDRQSYQGITKEEHPGKVQENKIRVKSLKSLREYDVEESDEESVNKKEKVFSTNNDHSVSKVSNDPNTVSKEQLSDDYADLLKTVCKGSFHLIRIILDFLQKKSISPHFMSHVY